MEINSTSFNERAKDTSLPTEAAISKAVDPEVLDSIRAMQDDDDPNLLGEMIEMYLSTAEGAVDSMMLENCKADLQSMSRTAHSLKGSSASIGAKRLAACCLVIEQICKNDTPERLPTILGQLEKEYLAVKEYLTRQIGDKAA